MINAVLLRAEVKQKADSLPRYVIIPDAVVSDWCLQGTTAMDGGKGQ